MTVPGPVPSQSLRATPFEDRILLYWKEPAEPNGIIIQYEVRPGAKPSNVLLKKLSQKEFKTSFCLSATSTDQLQRPAFVRPFGASPETRPHSVSAIKRHLSPVFPAPPGRHIPALYTSVHLQRIRPCDHTQRDHQHFRFEYLDFIFIFCISYFSSQSNVRRFNFTHICSAAPTIDEYDGSEAFLNETATTITVLLKPAQAKGAPIRYCMHF